MSTEFNTFLDGLSYMSVLGIVHDVPLGSQIRDCLGRCLLGGFKGCAYLIGCEAGYIKHRKRVDEGGGHSIAGTFGIHHFCGDCRNCYPFLAERP